VCYALPDDDDDLITLDGQKAEQEIHVRSTTTTGACYKKNTFESYCNNYLL